MEKLSYLKQIKKVHFIGVGGISMSALAKWCLAKNILVSGSDKSCSSLTCALENLGAKIYIGHNKKNIEKDVSLVVYTSAIDSQNQEFKKALKMKVKMLKRSEFLSLILRCYKNSIAVSGSHGKTTCSSMLTHILHTAKLSPTAFIGGIDKTYSNFLNGKKDYLVVEACEYKKNFLDLSPKCAVVLNIDNDHMDSYKNEHNMICAFEHFIANKLAFINNDCNKCKTLVCKNKITFGLNRGATYRAKYIKKNERGYSFTVYKNKVKLGRINLSVYGKHNIYNALASLSVAYHFNVDFEIIKKSLQDFSLAEWRGEYLGKISNLLTYADYAHHPSEITATLKAFNLTENDIIVFQPNTYSRTENLLESFKLSLKVAKNLIIYKTYSAREKYNYLGSAKRLFLEIQKENNGVLYAKNIKELKRAILQMIKDKKRIIFLGAGDIYDIAKNLLN